MYAPEQRVEVKEEETGEGTGNSLSGSALGNKPEGDTSDGVDKVEDGSLQRQFVIREFAEVKANVEGATLPVADGTRF